MNKICELQIANAIKAIEGADTVMYRHGVWNKYELVSVERAIKGIQNSGYGADVYENCGVYYVSIPCDSDMW